MTKAPMHADFAAPAATIDPDEVAKFERMASEWWDPDGKFRPLHKLNPVRLAFVRDIVAAHFGRDAARRKPFEDLRVLDIGCGGGLLSEPMARLGADIVGADPAPGAVAAARLHAEQSGLVIDYRATGAEALVAAGERFDVVLAMEVVEHVADVTAFLAACAKLLKPGGLLFVATLNRTPKAFALAIVGAEYLLRWLPRGAHDYAKLIRPDELEAMLAAAGLAVIERTGMTFDVFRGTWGRAADLGVNYAMAAERRPAEPTV